jgi:hypothetical protein
MAELHEGLGAGFAMAADASLKFFPISISLPGVKVGKQEITKLSNTAYKTFVMETLKEVGSAELECLFDMGIKADIIAFAGVNTLCTFTAPDASTEAVYGAIGDYKFAPFKAGSVPTVTLTIEVTNVHSSTGAETGPA